MALDPTQQNIASVLNYLGGLGADAKDEDAVEYIRKELSVTQGIVIPRKLLIVSITFNGHDVSIKTSDDTTIFEGYLQRECGM